MDQNEHINYWIISAEHDFETANTLFENGKYDWCLYIGHLVIEKVLKAHFVKDNNDVPPRTHNLSLLATKTKLKVTQDLLNSLDLINTFNLEARYPDEKMNFYKICTKEFAELNFNKIIELYQWLKSILK